MTLLPRTLYGRLVVILVSGMLAAQVLTSSIWYDVRHSQVLEIPTRLIASRLADIVRVATTDPRRTGLLLQSLSTPAFNLELRNAPSAERAPLTAQDRATESLLRSLINEKTATQTPLNLLNLTLLDNQGHKAGIDTLFGSSPAAGQFTLELRLADGRWLHVQAREDQGWTSLAPADVMIDYFLRIYLVRIIVVAIIVLLAVRLAVRPLNQLAQAAQALGQDIRRQPLPIKGPVEVQRAAQAFNLMQQRLLASLAERTRFLAAVSHDLRSPITRLRLRTEMLDNEPLKERFRKDLTDMEGLVSTTLDFVSSGEINEPRQSIDINALLQSLQADLQDVGEHITLTGRATRPFSGYARSLKRCVQNLLENAVRYARDVHVIVDEQPASLTITVRDSGPGIAPEQLTQVLEPFYRLESSRNSSTGGYGLGLSIAQTVAAAHGGTLELHNRPDGGLDAVLRFENSC
ncbi:MULTISPECIES: ATP-binding protein [unclassified Pseudomonas]|jgi:signal transduction histidine kinase|uniref:ATP-binding protein n=1 Tax=unclassified Pseudomonas TaxID=196821 RepID=UPI001056A337|nr:ATP-binding protein [Pseudomonas sp. MS-1(2024)]MEC4168040.1 ATP-binding protein [Pseudomonas sp. MS-1(2024)]